MESTNDRRVDTLPRCGSAFMTLYGKPCPPSEPLFWLYQRILNHTLPWQAYPGDAEAIAERHREQNGFERQYA